MGISQIHRTVAGTILTPFGDVAISLITARDTLRTRLRGPSPQKIQKKKKNTALCVYVYLTEYFKIKRTNEIRKEINKKIEKLES